MKNKIELKKSIIMYICILIFFIVVFTFFNYFEYKKYTNNFNKKIDDIISNVIEYYPEVDINDIVGILNGNTNISDNILKEYGIDLKKDSLVLINEQYSRLFIFINIILLLILSISLLTVFLTYNKKKDKKLFEITQYIEEINRKNYKLDIDDNTEDELSILKNEIYKTTIMLKEQAENSINDKINLKNSLSDISHQLKTPLTSIMIMLDNIIDNPNMHQSVRQDFIKDIRREIININFLIQSILKLSKFDANAIDFIIKDVKVLDIINEAVKNVSVLCDLKNVKVIINGDVDDIIKCDLKWQVEAITNILKNAVEYSNSGNKVIINCNKNKLYYMIEIIDSGKGIEKEDILHIFERFYRAKNSARESVGIGLSLAKSIVEKGNGSISVESRINKGTKFVIKYFYN